MTLIEIIFSVALLLIMTLSATSIIRNNLDMRFELAQQSKVNHRLMVSMQRLTDDIEQAFLLDTQRPELLYGGRSTKAIFAIRLSSDSSELRLTSFSHRAINAAVKEGDQAFVVYRVEKDSATGRPNLMRGETAVIPTNLEDDPPLSILARNIKSIKLYAWNGEDWKDEWDTNRSDWRNTLPRMVRIEVEAFINEPEGDGVGFADNDPTTRLQTIVFLQSSLVTREQKEPAKSAKYY